MSTLSQIREGFSRAWDHLSEGWHELGERARHALTRFHPTHSGGDLETVEEQTARSASRWALLAAEVKDSEDEVEVKLEVPGMDAEDFDIQVVDNNILVVRGEKRVEREGKRGRYYVMECAYGQFERAVPLPSEVDDTKASAQYRQGILRITLPKSQQSRTQRITVGSS